MKLASFVFSLILNAKKNLSEIENLLKGNELFKMFKKTS